MTFPHDLMQDDIRAEEHSVASIVLVSSIMILATLGAIATLL